MGRNKTQVSVLNNGRVYPPTYSAAPSWGEPVQNVAELAALPQRSRPDGQRRTMIGTGGDVYLYLDALAAGDVQPNDSDGSGTGHGNGWWIHVTSEIQAFGDPVADLAALAAVAEHDRSDGQVRAVIGEGGDLYQYLDALAAGDVLPDDSDGTGIGVGNGWWNRILIDPVERNEDQIFYVGKHGNDGNDGRNIGDAFLTFAAGIAAATALVPGPNNQIAIRCNDNGIYTEDIDVPDYVHVIAPSAVIIGEHTLQDSCSLEVGEIRYAGANVAVYKTGCVGQATVKADRIELTDGASGIEANSGDIIVDVNYIHVEDGNALVNSGGGIYATCEGIYVTGTGVGLYSNSVTGLISIQTPLIDCTTGTGIYFAAGVCYGNVGAIFGGTAYDVDGTLFLNCAMIGGIKAGTGNIAVWSPVEEANILYVGQYGDDGNDGSNPSQAVLTIGQALTLAAAEIPAIDNQITIRCSDASIYTEDVDIPSYVHIDMPNAAIVGNITLEDASSLTAREISCSAGTLLDKDSGALTAIVNVKYASATSGATGITCTSGYLIFNADLVSVDTGSAFTVGAGAYLNAIVNTIYLTGIGNAISIDALGYIAITASVIMGATGTAINMSTGVLIATVNYIVCNTAYLLGASAITALTSSYISGTRSNAGKLLLQEAHERAGEPTRVTGGEDIAIGEPVYLSSADGECYKTDASALATVSRFLGLAYSVGGDGIVFYVKGPGTTLYKSDWTSVTGSATLTAGAMYYASTTAGDLTTTAPGVANDTDYNLLVGYAISTTEMLVIGAPPSAPRVENPLVMQSGVALSVNASTMTGNLALATTSPIVQSLDPNGSDRTITVPGSPYDGQTFIIKHIGSANTLTIDGHTLYAGDICVLVYDETNDEWIRLDKTQQFQREIFPAGRFDACNNADWAVNGMAPSVADGNNAAITARAFDDTTEEGVGFSLYIPPEAQYMKIKFISRVGAVSGNVGPRLYSRLVPDDVVVPAWSAATALDTLVFDDDEFWQQDEQVILLSTLSLTAGNMYDFELTRNPGIASDVTGDWYLRTMIVEIF